MRSKSQSHHLSWQSRVKIWQPLVIVLALLAAVNFLPPDTSLAEVHRTGVLRVCLPTDYPPLVLAKGELPGLEVEMVSELAKRLELRLALNTNSTMGRDINPRNWRLNRAQCEMVIGGILASPTTRSYLETTTPHLSVGWAIVMPEGEGSLTGADVAVFTGFSGFDRIELGRYLRDQGAKVRVVNSRSAFEEALKSGDYAFGVTESLAAQQVGRDNGWPVAWLAPVLGHTPLAFGLWKGDLTLQRAVERQLSGMHADGTVSAMLKKYNLDQQITSHFAKDVRPDEQSGHEQ